MKHSALVLGGLLAFSGTVAATIATDRQLHFTAMDVTDAFSAEKMSVPKVYVFHHDELVYESPTEDADPLDKALYSVLTNDQAPALAGVNASHGDSVLQLLRGRSVLLDKSAITLVSLEFGKTMGFCPGCENYFPILKRQLDDISAKVNWVHLYVEKNSYKPSNVD